MEMFSKLVILGALSTPPELIVREAVEAPERIVSRKSIVCPDATAYFAFPESVMESNVLDSVVVVNAPSV
jgi:hypothetical protein